MDVPVEVRDIVARAATFESVGNNAGAQAGYLDAMQRLGQRASVFRGTLYINLGTNAQDAGWLDDAATFFRRSIELLEGERGEAHLQCAHAHFNLAHLLLHTDDPAAPAHAAEASKRYHANPFASPVDRANAAMLSVLCSLFILNQGEERTLRAAWEELSTVNAPELNRQLLKNFLLNWLGFNRRAHLGDFPDVQRAVRHWLGNLSFEGPVAGLLQS